jgi:hypothetical protein
MMNGLFHQQLKTDTGQVPGKSPGKYRGSARNVVTPQVPPQVAPQVAPQVTRQLDSLKFKKLLSFPRSSGGMHPVALPRHRSAGAGHNLLPRWSVTAIKLSKKTVKFAMII